MAREWSAEQKAAIEFGSGAAIVSAAAGSGKTTVLVERVTRAITDPDSPLDPAALAVVTFTEKAASEMKSRIFESLNEKMRTADKEYQKMLRTQSGKLKNAKISTISSFCFRIMRDNIDLTDFSSGFTVIDEKSAGLLQHRVLDNVLEDFYKNATEEDLRIISDHYISKNDSQLCDLIFDIYKSYSNFHNGDEWLSKCENGEFERIEKVRTKERADIAYKSLKSLFSKLSEAYEKTGNAKYSADTEKIKDTLIKCVDEISEAGYEIGEPVTADQAKMPRSPSNLPGDIKLIREAFKKASEDFIKLCNSLITFDEENDKFRKVVKILVKLTRDFAAAYKAEKISRNSADFSDAEQSVYKMLIEHPELKERVGLKMIIVDEFQDSNEIQYEIFRRLSDDEKNLYFVGDIKQSIYSFRNAEPQVFSDRLIDSRYHTLPMNMNFRSGKNVIDGVNEIFDRMMTKDMGGADYEKDSRLVFGRKVDFEPDTSPVEICCLHVESGSDEKAVVSEARYVARRIRSMIDSGYITKGRLCREEDFVIILRSIKDKAGIFADALSECSLKSNIDVNDSFTKIEEVSIMLDFLAVLDNPYRDDALARLLMSPVFSLDTEEIARLRSGTVGLDLQKLSELAPEVPLMCKKHYAKSVPFFTCLNDMAKENGAAETIKPLLELINNDESLFDRLKTKKYRDILSTINRLRSIMAGCTPGELVRAIYDTTDTIEILCVGENADEKAANLHLLEKYAESFSENVSGGNVSDFLADLSRLESSKNSLSGVKLSDKKGVSIISVHKSKGLQFPICFISNCNNPFNNDYAKSDIAISKRSGISGRIVCRERMSKVPTPLYNCINKEIENKQKSEEMRLLYVAATRAEEKLIFTGCKRTKDFDLTSNEGILKKASTDGNNWFSWLTSLLEVVDETTSIDENGDACYKFSGHLLFRKFTTESVCSDEIKKDEVIVVSADSKKTDKISDALKYKYSNQIFTATAAKFTATELVKNRKLSFGNTRNCELYISRPDFYESEKPLSGKARGDAYHKAMEHMPFEKTLTSDEISIVLDNMLAENILTEKERECIAPDDIEKFFITTEAERMIKSKSVRRESPIFHRLDINMVSAAELGLSADTDITRLKENPPYIQGIVDLFFVEENSIVIIDYKTDKVSTAKELADEYGFQLDIYADALSQMLLLPVKQKLLYSFALGQMIDVDKLRGEHK